MVWALVAGCALAQADPKSLVVPVQAGKAPIQLPDECPSPGDPLEVYQAALQRCQGNAVFLGQLGHLLNTNGRYADALEHLERALMLDPRLKSVQIDFAVALAETGDAQSAIPLLDSVLAEPDLPAYLEPILKRQRAMYVSAISKGAANGEPQLNAWRLRRFATVRLGGDSNLLGSPRLSSLTLTFPDVDVTLPLEGDKYKPRSGAYLTGELTLEAAKRADGGAIYQGFASLRAKAIPSISLGNNQQYEFSLQRNQNWNGNQGLSHYQSVVLAGVSTQAGARYRLEGLSAGIEGVVDAKALCQTRVGLDGQQRTYLNSPVLSGRYGGVAAALNCASGPDSQWQLNMQAGRDQATQDARPGGDQNQYLVRFVGTWPAGRKMSSVPLWPTGWLIDALVTQVRDATGFSPLLEAGQKRIITRAAIRLEGQYLLRPNMMAMAGAEWTQQAATLPLFEMRSWGPYVGLRYVW